MTGKNQQGGSRNNLTATSFPSVPQNRIKTRSVPDG